MGERLILASASPRRLELLLAAGFEVEVRPAHLDETLLRGESAPDYVLRLARAKAAAIPGEAVLGADTTVVVEGEILGKPRDDAEAAAMLRRLAGRCHEVLTGFCLRRAGREIVRIERTLVWMAELTGAEIAAYVASGEPRDKAGAYAIQGLASRFIPRIEGSYANVVGLPVSAVWQAWRELN